MSGLRSKNISLDVQVAITALLLGIGNGMLHWQAVDRPWRDYQTNEHIRVIAGTFVSPDQYRILTYGLAEGLVRLGLPIHSAHEVWRVIFTAASLFVLYRYLRGWFRPVLSLMGMFMLAAVIPLTYVYYMMQVSDPLNMLIFFLAFWAIREEQDRWLIPLVGVGMLNRESPIMLPLFYAAIRWGRPWRQWVPIFAVSSALAVAVYFGLRLVYGPKTPCCSTDPVEHLIINFTDWRAYVDTFAVLNLALWGSWIGWRRRPAFLRRASLVVPLFLVPYLMYGTVRESRYYLPVLAILIPLSLFYLLEVGATTDTPEAPRDSWRPAIQPHQTVSAASPPVSANR